MRSILDAIKGEDGWRGLGSPGLNQGQQPALTSAPCEAELAPNSICSSSTVLTMATTQRNYDPMPRLGLDKGVYSVPDVFAFDIGATGRKHSSILGYLSSALSGLLPCASAFAPCVPSVRPDYDDLPAPIPDPCLPLHYTPSPTYLMDPDDSDADGDMPSLELGLAPAA